MLIKIKCSSCGTDTTMSMMDSSYKMPFRCWKCKSLYTLKVKDGEITLLEPLAQEEFDKQKAAKEARRKKAKEKTA